MDIVIWTIVFLSSAPNLKGESNATSGSPLNEVISDHLPMTQNNIAVEAEPTLATVNIFPRHTDTSHTVATGLSPPSEPVSPHATLETWTASLQASTPSALTGRITSPNTESHTAQVKDTTVTRRSVTTPASTISSSSPSAEHQTSSAQATITTSEMVPLVPSFTPSGLVSTLTVLTDNPETTGLAPLENFKQDTPSELDVGDEALGRGLPASPLDLLLTGLVSIFIFSTALLSIMLFLRFRQQSQHPEFHRLQDLPMDDLLEDTPLSRYTY
ncbi:mucin-3A isoform X2 [Electrophorus electricus]|uniref:mucin-3A isoform X2 n=1 Tax=Electrophorus electricus TaxID=8005 RepID=UPI0015CF9000|nr:mucin-3A isoform X2 [Electrophorus electricus]